MKEMDLKNTLKFGLSLGFCLSFGLGLMGQGWQEAAADFRKDPQSGSLSFIEFRPEVKLSHEDFPQWLTENLELGQGYSFQFIRTETDKLGISHTKFQEYYFGYRVYGGTWTAHSKGPTLLSGSGQAYSVVPSHPTLTEAAALSRALEILPSSKYAWQSPADEAILKHAKGDPNATFQPKGELVFFPDQGRPGKGKFRLAWMFDIYSLQPLDRALLFIDAQSGELLFKNPILCTIDVPSTAQTRYSGTQNIVSDSLAPGVFNLIDNGRKVETYDMDNQTDYGAAIMYTETDRNWNLAGIKMSGLDAHWGAEMTYDYYLNQHGRNSYDNLGSPLMSYVSFDVGYVNAFWDGTRMTYGDGGMGYGAFPALDVCGHEFSHGVTEYSAGLIYQDESGALNESFSDIFGASIEFLSRPSRANWLVGEDVTMGGLRDMSDPKSFADPRCYQGQFWYTGSADNGGVHKNSGVQNWWYYLLTDGGSGLNDFNQAYSVSGLGIDTAGAIAYRTLSVYLQTFSIYEDAWFYSIQAAEDLYGPCSRPVQQVMNAWFACGIGSPYGATLRADMVANDTVFCLSPVDVEFRNQAQGGISYEWRFGDGGTSLDDHPIHTYSNPGFYTVTLIVTGCDGTRDTLVRPNMIRIDPNLPCSVVMPQSGTYDTQTSCEGRVRDSGGDGNYLNNVSSYLTISPAGATQVMLTFTQFDFPFAGDYISLYDGPSNTSPLIGNFSGTNLPNGGTILSSGPSLTLAERTNNLNNGPGFEAHWTCLVGNDRPQIEKTLSLFPNPAQSSVVVAWDAQGPAQIVVVDLLGKTHLTRREESGSALEVSDLPSGLYLVGADWGSGYVWEKLEVRR